MLTKREGTSFTLFAFFY
uniref:Uncharacterized protein n=1 Tax=Arundo donax TaxID=35708 RepID=A0A0A8Z389_ARUDO